MNSTRIDLQFVRFSHHSRTDISSSQHRGATHITVKVTAKHGANASTFEVIVPPGYDVGAHVHSHQAELFYILEGELDLLAFEPLVRTEGNWQEW
jgi:mannose-6-phosphate isomerase-like protein (cupin superfamily)